MRSSATCFQDAKQISFACEACSALQVCGYVQHVSKAGMFVALAHDVTARVKLGQLAASFVEDPQAAFPPGTLVKGRILSVQGDRSATPPPSPHSPPPHATHTS